MESLKKRIVSHPDVLEGSPCINGTRLSVSGILMRLACGSSVDDLLSEYKYLEKEDICSCFYFASCRIDDDEVT